VPSNTSSLRKCLEEQSRHLFDIFFRNNECIDYWDLTTLNQYINYIMAVIVLLKKTRINPQ
jgi:hypothetical protein